MKIMLVADVHIRTNVNVLRQRRTYRALKTAFSSVECDMAVVLGDLMHGPDYKDDKEQYVKDLRKALEIINSVPFAFVFGNHDDECLMTKGEILSIMSEYNNSLTEGENYVLRRNGETLLFIDSGSYGGKESFYDTVKPEVINRAKYELGSDKAILFQHIIVPDIIDALEKRRKLNFPLIKTNAYRFKKGFKYTGELKERPCPPDINTGELHTFAPNLKAAVFGHDHINSFECELEGVKLIQCQASGVNCYEYPQRPTVKLLDTETLETRKIKV